MNELINIKNQQAVMNVIGKALREEKYEIAACILSELNNVRIEHGLEPYSVQDVLFMRLGDLISPTVEHEQKCLYVAEFSDNSVKIGISKNPRMRLDALSYQKGREVKRFCYTYPIENAHKIEQELHSIYSKQRIKGEYFDVDFNTVFMTLNDKYKLGVSVSKSIYDRYAGIEAANV